ncbi:MAG: response regulator [Flavobacterium sp.]|nr:MAG: response regulator [Flavobacterium sp.]
MKKHYSRSKVIYLIEPDMAITDVMAIMFAEDGHRPIISKKPFDVKDLYIHRPDIIILDNGPDNKGIEICRQIKNDNLTSSIDIIISSTDARLPQWAKEYDVTAYIQKPFDVDHFCSLVATL